MSTSVRHVCLTVSALNYCNTEKPETHDAVRNVLMGGDGLGSERGDEKGKLSERRCRRKL